MKRLALAAAAAAIAAMSVPAIAAPLYADVVAIVDESGSMAGEHAWLAGMMPSLQTGLTGAGLTNNRYGLVGFGGGGNNTSAYNLGRQVNIGGNQFGTSAQFVPAAGTLGTGGSFEDGYSAINFANGYGYRADAARNYILVTDEDRDNGNNALNYANILAGLDATDTLLNAVVNATFSCTGATGQVLGIGGGGVGYIAGAGGTYTTATGCSATSGYGSTIADYVNLAIASGGAAWNLNILRDGGNGALAFTNAFVDIKVQEITTQPGGNVPEPGTLALLGASLLGWAGLRRRKSK